MPVYVASAALLDTVVDTLVVCASVSVFAALASLVVLELR